MDVLSAPIETPVVNQRLDDLVQRHLAAQNAGIRALNALGGQAESALTNLPTPVKTLVTGAVERALIFAMHQADRSRRVLPQSSAGQMRGLATALGAAGGLGGIATALVELPITTIVLLRSIQDAAVLHGFDPSEEGVKFDCIEVLSSAGPLDVDDGSDVAFLTTRLALTGRTVQALIRRVAPHLTVVLGQKLATQAVPLIGAAAGAGTNRLYVSYYSDMAYVHFGLRRLAIEADQPLGDMVAAFRARLKNR